MGLSGQRCEALTLKSQISSRHRLAHHRVFHHRGQLGPWVIFSCKVSIQMGLVPLSLQGTSCLKNKVQLGKWRGGGKRRDAHLSLAEQRRGSSKHAALRAGESTGSYKLLINVG